MSKRRKLSVLAVVMMVLVILCGCNNEAVPDMQKETMKIETTKIEAQTKEVETNVTLVTKQDIVSTTSKETVSIVLSDYLYDQLIEGWVYASVNTYSTDDLSKKVFTIGSQKEVNIIGQYEDMCIINYNNQTVLASTKNIIEKMNYEKYDESALNQSNIIGSSKTVSTSTSSGRATNMAVSSKELNVVIPAGAAFSFNAIVGPRTSEKGYKKASVIQNGGYVQGLGGGICQTSTTVYMAVLNAVSNGYNFKTIERHDHQLPVEYAKRGEEAAIYWGSCDQRWVNQNDFDIAIRIWTENQTVFVEFYKI